MYTNSKSPKAAQDNGIGVRVIRTEPLDHRFEQLLFDKSRRGLYHQTDWSRENSDTIVISNTPFWATNELCLKLCHHAYNKEGFYRAGRVKFIMNTHLIVGLGIVGRNSRLGKIVENYFEARELCTVFGQFYVPKSTEDSLWVELTPRKTPLVDNSVEELHELMDIFFDWETNIFNRKSSAKLAPKFAQRLHLLQQKYE